MYKIIPINNNNLILFLDILGQNKTLDELDEYVMLLEAHRIKVVQTLITQLLLLLTIRYLLRS